MRESLVVKTEGERKLKEVGTPRGGHHQPILIHGKRFEYERICCDPKRCELFLGRMKSRETLMEVRSGSNVQIDRQTWEKGRKTNRIP